MIVQERVSAVDVIPQPAAEGCSPTVRIEVRAPKRRPDTCEYLYRPIPCDIGGRAVEFTKLDLKDSTVSHVRYGFGRDGLGMSCDCRAGEMHERYGRPMCRHCLAVQTLVNLGLLPDPTAAAA